MPLGLVSPEAPPAPHHFVPVLPGPPQAPSLSPGAVSVPRCVSSLHLNSGPVPFSKATGGGSPSLWQREEPREQHSPTRPASHQLEVSQLEGSLQQPQAQSAMSPYLVPDTQALCHHLPIIRQLATSGRFIVIIPRTGERSGELGGRERPGETGSLVSRHPYSGPSSHTVASVKS